MSEPPVEKSQGKPCRTCCEPIALGAQKCIHCGSYQDLRRYFTFSSTVLSLLVALLSVTGLVAPIVADLLKPNDSYIEFSPSAADGDALYVFTTNSGKQAGTFNSGELILWSGGGYSRIRFRVADFSEGVSFLPAGSSKLVKLVPAGIEPTDAEDYYYRDEYRFRGYYSSTQGTKGSLDIVSAVETDTVYGVLLAKLLPPVPSGAGSAATPNKRMEPTH
jgi:hypothetical protein